VRLLLLVIASAGLLACGSAEPQTPVAETPAPREFNEPPADSDIDESDPARSLLPDSPDAEKALMRKLGKRRDFRVPREAVAELTGGPLARAVIARIWNELDTPYEPDPRYRRLTPGQRALFALQWADAEILNGGFDQFWANDTGYFGPDLVGAAQRVGFRELQAVFGDAERLFPDGRIPRDRNERTAMIDGFDEYAVASLDDRYAELQYHRRTALGLILGAYVEQHPDEFFA
jgi:hypothetical protein